MLTLLLKRAALAAALLLPAFAAFAQAPTVQWDRTLGGTDDDRLNVVQPTADGGYILGGYSASGISGSKTQASFGGVDYWVVKLDATGAKVWDKTYGGSAEDRLTSLQQTADGGYILGGISSSPISGTKTQAGQGGLDAWVLKIDATGTKVWDRTLGSNTDDRLTTIRQTADGGYIVGAQSGSGSNGDRSTAGQGGLDYWLIKLDATGAKTWDRSLGGTNNDIMNAVTPTTDGGYLLGGFSYSAAGGDKSQGTRGTSDYDFWVIKVNATGTKVWDATLGGTGFDNLTSLVQNADGSYLVGGFSNSPISGEKTQNPRGDYDNWIVKLSATGAKVWDFTFGGDGYDSLNSLVQTADGGYLLGSQSSSGLSGDKTQANYGPAGSPDYWVVKTDATGLKQWDASYGGTQDDVLTSLAQTTDGGYVLGGFSSSGISGTKTQASQGNFDFWVVRLRPSILAAAAGAGQSPFALFPNPATGSFTLQLPATAPHLGLHLQLLDATGRLVWQQQLAAPTDGRLLVAPGVRPGLYLARLQGPTGYLQTQRLVLH